MGDTESLLLVLGLIYLAECVVWVRGGALAFSSWRGDNYRVRHPGQGLGNVRGGLLLAGPLPPLGRVFVCSPPPFSISPTGLFGFVTACLDPTGRSPQTGGYATWQGIRDLRLRGKKLWLNNKVFAGGDNLEAARINYSRLERLIKATTGPAREEELLRQRAAWFDEKSARDRLKSWGEQCLRLHLLANLLFVYLFLVSPWLVIQYGMVNVGWWVVAGLLLQTFTLSFLFRSAHRELYPADGESRFRHFLTMLLAPPSAIRAPDVLGRPLFAGFHPLVVGHLLMSPQDFARWSRLVWADLKHPLMPIPRMENEPREMETWHRKMLLQGAEKFLSKVGMDLAAWNKPPARTDPGHRSYCPRCLAQYCLEKGACGDCGGVTLRVI